MKSWSNHGVGTGWGTSHRPPAILWWCFNTFPENRILYDMLRLQPGVVEYFDFDSKYVRREGYLNNSMRRPVELLAVVLLCRGYIGGRISNPVNFQIIIQSFGQVTLLERQYPVEGEVKPKGRSVSPSGTVGAVCILHNCDGDEDVEKAYSPVTGRYGEHGGLLLI
eukprot:sb/3472465/